MPKITVLPSNQQIEIDNGANLRETLISSGLGIKSPCGGCASCAQCVVVINSNPEALNEISFEEKQILGNVFHLTAERLSCQTIVSGDVTVDISAHIEVKPKQVVTKRRTRLEADTIIEERREKAKERPQRPGGLKRPKAFKYENKKDS